MVVVLVEIINALQYFIEGDVPDFVKAISGDVGALVGGAVGFVVEDAEGGVEVEENVVEVDADGEGVLGII